MVALTCHISLENNSDNIFNEGGEGDNRGWDGWMASLTQWTWVWVNSGITGDAQGGLVCCDSWGLKESDSWTTELNGTELTHDLMDFPKASMVKNPPQPAVQWLQETHVQSLRQEDPLQKHMAVFLPGESCGPRSLEGTVHGVTASDTAEVT